MPRYVVGIDPGKTGGVAIIPILVAGDRVIQDVSTSCYAYPLPLRPNDIGKGKTICCNTLRARLAGFVGDLRSIKLVVIEKVGNRPSFTKSTGGEGAGEGHKQGGTSMFTFGLGVGKLIALFELGDFLITYPHPLTWQKHVFGKARATGSPKDRAIAYAQGRFPDISLLPTKRTKNPHIGVADSLCIASYGLLWLQDNLALLNNHSQ